MGRFAIMRLSKVKTMAHVAGLGKHIERERETRNADPERTDLNERLAGSGDWQADVQARLDMAPKIRKNAVLAIEHVLTASPEFFASGTPQDQDQRRDAFRDASMEWLRETYGPDNIVAAVMHMDESSPHIQALVVPIDERGRLNARHFIGGDRTRLAELQTNYAAKVAPLGLERGIEGSVATHQEVKRWYAQVEQPPREVTQQVSAAVQIEPPGTVVARPREYARQQHDRVVASVTQHAEALARQCEALAWKVERQERQIDAMAKRDPEQRARVALLREVELPRVMTALGATRDERDDSKWHLAGEVISVNGQKFYNHDRQQGGGGAIDLVMHAQGYTFKEAVAWLRDEVGREEAVAAVVTTAAAQAQEIADREPRPPFREPEPQPSRWPQVRRHLIERCSLPRSFVDSLHDQGKVYADRRNNAVFLRTNDRGEVTGAHLIGTWEGNPFAGVAAGTRKNEGWFQVTVRGQQSAEEAPPTLIIAGSPVDAVAVLEIHRLAQEGRECGPVTVIAVDSAGGLPHQAIREALQRGGVVRVAVDNDPSGDRIWRQVHEQYPDPVTVVRDRPTLGDWTDVLREQQSQRAERERAAPYGQGQMHRDRDLGYGR
jgi:Plasmid recombination enzyme/Protein of unknown function (DUF3991)